MSTTKGRNKPPKFLPGKDYKAWKTKTEIWLGLDADLPKKDQAPLIRLYSFDEHPAAEAAVEHLTLDELANDDGLKALWLKLDQNFLEDALDELYSSFRDVFEYTRNKQESVLQYIVNFEHKWDKMATGCGQTGLAPELKGSFLLYNANLSQNDRNIILASVTSLKYADMKSTMKRVFNKQNPGREVDVAESSGEIAFYTNRNKYNKSNYQSSQYRDIRRVSSPHHKRNNKDGGYSSYEHRSSKAEHFRPRVQSKIVSNPRKLNPRQKNGKISLCIKCHSNEHWIAKCPHKDDPNYVRKPKSSRVYHGEHHQTPEFSHSRDQQDDEVYERRSDYYDYDEYGMDYSDYSSVDEEVYVVLMSDENGKIAIPDSSETATIDTACSKVVMGLECFNGFYKKLPEEYSQQIIFDENGSNTVFQFGDGKKVQSIGRATIPIRIGDTDLMLTTEVVQRNIPLLLSKKFLKKAEAVLDMKDDTVIMFGQNIPTTHSQWAFVHQYISCFSRGRLFY